MKKGKHKPPQRPGPTLPVVYRPEYNITLAGLQRLHPFDSEKYGRVVDLLVDGGVLQRAQLFRPEPVSQALLERHLTAGYLRELTRKETVARITEISLVKLLPMALVRSRLLEPMRHATGGTLAAARLALRHGWAINLGGGYHHASLDAGGGFCVYPDITLAVLGLRRERPELKVMIIDLDAHQGDGHGRDLGGDPAVFILDVYNHGIYPGDSAARRGIDLDVDAPGGTGTEAYLALVKDALDRAFARFSPDLVIYNAGTDVLAGDPLGALAVSAEGVLRRDALVFGKALAAGAPLVMLLSGGYQDSNAAVIAGSIENLFSSLKLPQRLKGAVAEARP